MTRAAAVTLGVGRHAGDIRSLAISANGRIVATGSRDQTVGLWDARTAAPIHTLVGQGSEVSSVSLSPDGAKAASAGDNGRVILWDVATGEQLVSLEPTATLVSFSPDGKRLATAGGRDKRVILWDTDIAGWAERACSMANRNLTCKEWRQYLRDLPYHVICPRVPELKTATELYLRQAGQYLAFIHAYTLAARILYGGRTNSYWVGEILRR